MKRHWAGMAFVVVLVGAAFFARGPAKSAEPPARDGETAEAKTSDNKPAAQPAKQPAVADAISDEIEKKLDREIAKHVQNLASSFAKIADAAEAALIAIGDRASDAVENLAKDANPEVATRAARILKTMSVHTHTVVDAMHRPIAGARLELRASQLVEGRLRPAAGGAKFEFVTSRRGHISIDIPEALRRGAYIVRFSHPDYGEALDTFSPGLTILPKPKEQLIAIPLVKRDSPESERAIKGTVVGPDDAPIAGAVVACERITLSGQGSPHNFFRGALSDEKGRFSYYPRVHSAGMPTLLEPKTLFYVSAEAPEASGLFPAANEFTNEQEARLKLAKPELFHRFKIEGRGGGFLKERRDLDRVTLFYIQPGTKAAAPLPHTVVSSGAKLLPGEYLARGLDMTYLSVEVTKESPEELIIKRPRTVKVRGRVINGVTGKPMPRVLVLGQVVFSTMETARITPDGWKQLQAMPDQPPPRHPALKALPNSYQLKSIARTDEQGDYELIDEPDARVKSVMALEDQFVSTLQEAFPAEKDGVIKARDIELFPASTVTFRPVVENSKERITALLHFDAQGQPEWFARLDPGLLRQLRGLHSNSSISLPQNTAKQIAVPSGVRFRVGFEAAEPGGASVIQTRTSIRLAEGEIRDLGNIKLRGGVRVSVLVSDSKGSPLPNVAVLCGANGAKPGELRYLTGDKGIASFDVEADSTGDFVVELPAPWDQPEKAPSAPFQVGQMAPQPNPPFKISLSDEQRRALAKPAGKE